MFKKRPKAQKLSHMGQIDELARSGKPVLVDFYQVGCAPCQVMDGIFNELAREYGTRIPVLELAGRFICQYTLDERAIGAILDALPE